jgi:hypothetical protein
MDDRSGSYGLLRKRDCDGFSRRNLSSLRLLKKDEKVSEFQPITFAILCTPYLTPAASKYCRSIKRSGVGGGGTIVRLSAIKAIT